MRVKIDIMRIRTVLKGHIICVKGLASAMGISTKSAGKILAKLEREGYAIRISNRCYKIL